MAPMTPTRFRDSPQIRAVHGPRVDRLARALSRTDPLADAVIVAFRELPPGVGWSQVQRAASTGIEHVPEAHPAIRGLFEQVEQRPFWVDHEVLARAGELLLRAGPFGGLVLGLRSLPYGYASPGGNKPLAFSGRLREQAPRRLMETARFVHAVSRPGAMDLGGDGYQITLKVRLMHAQVRRLILDSGRWDATRWGAPINQHDQLATTLLFSVVVIDGLRRLGFEFEADETNAFVHLWRYVGWLMGTEAELLPETEPEGLALGDLILSTQDPPDDDSRALTKALLDFGLQAARTPLEKKRVELSQPFSRAVAHHLLGRQLADGLGIERSALSSVLPLVRRSVGLLERFRVRSTTAHRLAVERGDRSWRDVIEDGLRGMPAEFRPPTGLSRHPDSRPGAAT